MGKELAGNIRRRRPFLTKPTRRWASRFRSCASKAPEADLKLTANTQPGDFDLLRCRIIAWLAEKGLTPDFVAGHSLGEYSALVAAGGLNLRMPCSSCASAEQYMQDAVPAGVGAMAAIMGFVAGCGCRCLQARLRKAKLFGRKSEFAGADGDLRACGRGEARGWKIASQLGAKRAVILPVSAPFHSA